MITKDPTAPQMCRYTTLSNLSVQKLLKLACLFTPVAACLSRDYKQDYWFLQTSDAIWLHIYFAIPQ